MKISFLSRKHPDLPENVWESECRAELGSGESGAEQCLPGGGSGVPTNVVLHNEPPTAEHFTTVQRYCLVRLWSR